MGAITIAPSSNFLVLSALLSSPKLCFDVLISFDSDSEPQNFLEATVHPGWQATMDWEMQAIYDNHTWNLVPFPPRCNPITTKWVYKVKKDQAGNIAKLKARLVARGFQQKEREDFEETFAPIVRWNTLCILVALATHRGWKFFHLDAVTAFLNGDIIQDLYIKQLEGYVVPGKEEFVCKLLKALYGLKQAPKAWYSKIDSFLSEK